MSSLRVAVMGAGAVGCWFGGMLARAGHDVKLVARAAHVQAIEAAGLRLQSAGFDEHVHLRAGTDAAGVRNADLVLFCVKSSDTEAAALAMRPHLGPHTLVLSLQNGVDNAERLRAVLTQPVRAAVVYVAAEMAGPGHVRHHARGELLIERANASDQGGNERDGSQQEAAWVQALCDAGLPVELTADVRQAQWVKLIVNCAYNALSAITQQPYGSLAAAAGVHDVMQDVVRECVAVAQAEGVAVPADIQATVRALAGTMPSQRSSTAQDLARGRRTEIAHLNGHVVQCGRRHGLPTPANRVLLTLVQLLESSQTPDCRAS